MGRMKWVFRKLGEDDTDYELVFGALLIPVFTAVALISTKVPGGWIPRCFFRHKTGIPCPTCGAYRSLCLLMEGDVWAAWRGQPLVISVVFLGALYALYSLVVVLGRLPRLRPDNPPQWLGRIVIIGVVLLMLLNWAYLVLRGV